MVKQRPQTAHQSRSERGRTKTPLLAWHGLFRGLYSRVAKRLGMDPSFVSRVARGERRSAKIERALRDELTRFDRLRRKR